MAKMNLDEFVDKITGEIHAFAAATRERQEAKAPGFVGPKYEHRDYADWCRELDAYAKYVNLEDKFRQSLGGMKL